ncbi:putative immunogenic protein [Actinobacillus equuli]|nr:putative immunogenic protein [Actinobacillus equuli]
MICKVKSKCRRGWFRYTSNDECITKTKGWTEANFKEALKLTPAEMGKALCEKDVDAISYNVGHPNAALKETANSCDIRLIPVTDEVVGKLVAEQSYYAKATIPAKVYKGVEQAVDSFGVYATLVTSSDVSEQQVYRVVKAVFENFDRFKNHIRHLLIYPKRKWSKMRYPLRSIPVL